MTNGFIILTLIPCQVFNKLLSLASTASSQKYQSHMWSQMLVSTHGFLKSISNVSGKDIGPLIKQWVYPSNLRTLCNKLKYESIQLDLPFMTASTCLAPDSCPPVTQRSEFGGEVLWQLCLQQEEERAGAGDQTGLHVLWNSEICGE